MLMKYDFLADIQSALAMLDADEAPESRDFLSALAEDEGGFAADPCETANRLLALDLPGPLPKVLRDLVEELLFAAYYDGCADALNDLGAQYYGGCRGFEQDFARAVEYYELAAAKGSRQARENLGYCHYCGRSVPVDYEKAFRCFAPGAFEGRLVSLYKIGDMYKNGYFVGKDPEEAFRIYTRCLDTMTDDAAPRAAGPVFLRVGTALLGGEGTKKDPKQALVCLQQAELFLFDMVSRGETEYTGSLHDAIDGQARARAELAASLRE